MSTLLKRLRKNTAILWIQSGGNRLPDKEKSQDQTSLPMEYTVTMEQSITNALKQVDFRSLRSGNGSGYGEGSSARSDITYHKSVKMDHIQKDCRSKGNGSSGKSTKKSSNELP